MSKAAVFVQEFPDTKEEERLRGRVRELEDQVRELQKKSFRCFDLSGGC